MLGSSRCCRNKAILLYEGENGTRLFSVRNAALSIALMSRSTDVSAGHELICSEQVSVRCFNVSGRQKKKNCMTLYTSILMEGVGTVGSVFYLMSWLIKYHFRGLQTSFIRLWAEVWVGRFISINRITCAGPWKYANEVPFKNSCFPSEDILKHSFHEKLSYHVPGEAITFILLFLYHCCHISHFFFFPFLSIPKVKWSEGNWPVNQMLKCRGLLNRGLLILECNGYFSSKP